MPRPCEMRRAKRLRRLNTCPSFAPRMVNLQDKTDEIENDGRDPPHRRATTVFDHSGQPRYCFDSRDEAIPWGASTVPAAISTTSGSSRSNRNKALPHDLQK